MGLDLTAVESFIAVTDSRHFGRAADRLGVSASALTKRIKRLEAAVGVPLIERDTAGYAGLTPAGRRFVQFAPQLLHAAQVAKTAATGAPVETLRLAVPAGVGVVAPLMPLALATLELALQHAYPEVGIESVRTAFPELTPALLAGDVDVVLTFGPSQRGRGLDPALRDPSCRAGRSNASAGIQASRGRARVRAAADDLQP